jgi:tRNA(Ile)-lysidine synthase
VDSSALFFWLLQEGISFDIAIVNYHTRETSDEEVAYAKELAEKYGKKIYIKDCRLEKFSENEARKCRYAFFEEIIEKYGYDTLITAHQLNDRLEWLFMQLSKGAGLKELIAMERVEERERYKIWRPFFNRSRREIISYLHKFNIKFFVDESNFTQKYKRNFIRHNFSDKFINLYEKGVKKSFEILESEKKLIFDRKWNKKNKCYWFEKSFKEKDVRKVDAILKILGILPTSAQRNEILKTDFNCVIQGKIAVDSNEKTIFVAPYVKTKLTKEEKEKFRKNKIPPKIRGYLAKEKICIT